MKYVNTSASEPIADNPRGTYRVVIAREVFRSGWFTSWPQIVADVLNNSASAAGFPMGSPDRTIDPDSSVAVLDYRAGSRPGAATVADLVAAVEAASPHAYVKSVERGGPVPGLSDGGAVAFNAERDAAQDEAERLADDESVLGRLTRAAKGVRTTLVAGAVIAAVVAAVIFLPRGRGQ